MLQDADSYDALSSGFSWQIPAAFNIAEAVCTRWAEEEPDRVCLYHYNADRDADQLTYGELEARANSLAHGLRGLGITRGDRVAILLPQGFDTVVAHMAIYKLAAIAVPLALLFGRDALSYRLGDSGARAILTNGSGAEKVCAITPAPSGLDHIVVAAAADRADQSADPRPDARVLSFEALVAEAGGRERLAEPTTPDTPAMMIYTSGTTGPPKGALHGHRVLLGHLPGIQFHHEFFPQPGDRMWTPADWAWAGGLLNALLPALYFGVPVVSTPAQKFDPHTAYAIMERLKVRNAFIPPTALRMMKAVANPRDSYALTLRTIGSAGEALGRETLDWGKQALGLTINEFYGQTECNLVLSACGALGVVKPGAIGRPVPGHAVAVIDERGDPCAAGDIGQIAIRRPDPVMFLEYWNNRQATEDKFVGDWMTTGDQGVMDDEGYISFVGRDDDVITSSGYRIGPSEIEDCLHAHEAVQIAAVIGKPDPVRTEVVKAYVVLQPGFAPTDDLAKSIREWVKLRLSAHEYPREVVFRESLPLTTTGKVIRRVLRDETRADMNASAG